MAKCAAAVNAKLDSAKQPIMHLQPAACAIALILIPVCIPPALPSLILR